MGVNDVFVLVKMLLYLFKGVEPPVLVFVQSKERAKELHQELGYDGVNVDVIHADRPQAQVSCVQIIHVCIVDVIHADRSQAQESCVQRIRVCRTLFEKEKSELNSTSRFLTVRAELTRLPSALTGKYAVTRTSPLNQLK